MFAAYNKIKSDIKLLPVKVDYEYVKYHNTGFIYDKIYCDKVYMVDVSSCYATILKNKGLISVETYNYLCSIPKKERLAAVGMMAGRKNVFSINEKGEIANHVVKKSEYADYFFYCVQETYRIMDECKRLLGNDYLFSWVDAIYFNGYKNVNIVMDYLRDKHKLDTTWNVLKEFEVELRKNYYRIRYSKNDEPKTFMDIPTQEQQESKDLLTYFLNNKIEQNETRKTKIRGGQNT